MPQEIERKFLVKGDFKKYAVKQSRIKQGYLSSAPGRTVRVRIMENKGFLTIKGVVTPTGVSRYEWEKEIQVSDAEELLKLCESGSIDKTRYYVPAGNFTFEVDEFCDENEGLIMAEIELKTESDLFAKPEWLGKEVTGDARYYNSNLLKNPYTKWKHEGSE